MLFLFVLSMHPVTSIPNSCSFLLISSRLFFNSCNINVSNRSAFRLNSSSSCVSWAFTSAQLVLKRKTLFSATISSIFWSSSETWSRFFLSVLSKTWYLFLHFSISHWRASPSLSMCCSIETSGNLSPHVNKTMVCFQTSSPRLAMCSSMIRFWSFLNDVSIGITKIKAGGYCLRRDRPMLSRIEVWAHFGMNLDEKYFHQPGVSNTVIFLPFTSPEYCVPSFVPSVSNVLLWNIVFAVELFPDRFQPSRTMFTSESGERDSSSTTTTQ